MAWHVLSSLVMSHDLLTFKVSTRNFPAFKKAFETLARKARKLGVEEPTWKWVASENIPAKINPHTREVIEPLRRVDVITVSGQAPKLNGWTFVAVLQHETTGNIIRRIPGTEDFNIRLDMRSAKAWCEQCQTVRRRLDTYVVAHEDGVRQMQVGGDCLKDFTGGDSPEAIARWAELLSTFKAQAEDEEAFEGEGGGQHEPLVEISAFLEHVACMIRLHGWISRTNARQAEERGVQVDATADLAWANCFPKRNQRVQPILAADRDVAMGTLAYAIGHFEKKEDAGLDDYEHNLRITVEGRAISRRGAGLAASLITYVDRLRAHEIERNVRASRNAISRFQGEVKKRGDFDLTVTKVVELLTDFGPSNMHIMEDRDGNAFVWKTATEKLEVGKSYKLRGTVKEHKTYTGSRGSSTPVEQTILTRCQILD